MKRIIVIAITLICSLLTFAQQTEDKTVKAETIQSFVAKSHPTEWYKEQAEAWQKRVDENPKDEWAWRNLFLATYYHDQKSNNLNATDGKPLPTTLVLGRMKEAIPDSYTYHLMNTRMGGGSPTGSLARAIELIPDNAYGGDLSFLAARAWLNVSIVNEAQMKQVFTMAYRKQAVPERIMRYNWNMLQSMEEGAIYFGNGDNCLIPGKMMQEALGLRQDVTILSTPFFFSKEYRDDLWKKLNIKPFEFKEDFSDYGQYGEDWGKHFESDVIMHIIRETGRPCYFFPDIVNYTALNQENLYNEGLLLKWSEQPYDNFAVAMKNVHEVYHLEYLAEPNLIYTDWETSDMFDMNYVHLLAHLVSKSVKKGRNIEGEVLFRLLYQAILMNHTDKEHKRELIKELHESSGQLYSLDEMLEGLER